MESNEDHQMATPASLIADVSQDMESSSTRVTATQASITSTAPTMMASKNEGLNVMGEETTATGSEDIERIDESPVFARTTTADNTTDEGESLSPVESAEEHKPVVSTQEGQDNSPACDPRLLRQREKITSLHTQIELLQAEINAAKATLSNSDAAATIARHIKLLHDYNEIRDVGLGLMGMVADRRRVRVGEVMGEFGVREGD